MEQLPPREIRLRTLVEVFFADKNTREELRRGLVMEKDQQTIPALQKKKGRLLVADDDNVIQKVLSHILSCMGHEVTLAGNGLEASTLFLKGSYDLVITDFEMPLMNGRELCALVKAQSPNTPVIVITGFWDDTRGDKVTKCADAVVPKPFSLQELEETVERLLT